ncbi:unnamed protein product [Arabidopsis halleri]
MVLSLNLIHSRLVFFGKTRKNLFDNVFMVSWFPK